MRISLVLPDDLGFTPDDVQELLPQMIAAARFARHAELGEAQEIWERQQVRFPEGSTDHKEAQLVWEEAQAEHDHYCRLSRALDRAEWRVEDDHEER